MSINMAMTGKKLYTEVENCENERITNEGSII